MADVSNAYQFLNESLQLGLSDDDLAMAEAQFREAFAEQRNYRLGVEGADFHENWEFITRLEPRSTPLSRASFTPDELREGRAAKPSAE